MTEEFEEQTSEPGDLGRYLDIARRRHLQFLIPLFLTWAVIWGSSWFLQARYKSSTLILVEQPSLPKNYVVPNVSDDLQDRLQSIQQQILSRTRLLQIIDKLNLYPSKPHHTLTPEDKVDRMRRDIDIEVIRDGKDDSISAFRINYSAPSPRIAQQVTGQLTSLFIDANLKTRQQESEDTTQFIEGRLAAARAALAQQDAQIRDYQSAHEGELPSQQATNLQILSGLQGQLQNEEEALSSASQQRVYYQSMIDQYRALQGSHTASGGGPSDLPTIDAQLEKLRTQLAELRTHYTDQFPDVQNVKRQIAQMEKTRASVVASVKNSAGSAAQHKSGPAAGEILDPAHNAPLLQLQSQLQANTAEVANREKAIASLKSRISDYQARLSAEPESEQKLDELTRGYEQSKANYDDLLKKENESQMATSMEQMQQGQRFSMLDPPSLPLTPDFPNRLKMCEAGLGAGLLLGVVIVAGLEFLDDRMHSEKDIRKMLSVPVIAEIPTISSPSDERQSRRRMLLGWATTAAITLCILAGSAFSYLHR